MKVIVFIVVFFQLLLSCRGQSSGTSRTDTVRLVTANQQMEKEFSEAYRVFKNQKDRFELKECHLYYNGQLVPIYDTAYKAFELFGSNYRSKETMSYLDKPIWIGCPLLNIDSITTEHFQKGVNYPKETSHNTRLSRMRIYFHHKKSSGRIAEDKRNDSLDALTPVAQYMLVEGYPVDKYTDFEKLNEYLKTIGSKPFGEYGWRKGGEPTREYAYGSSKCATELMEKFAVGDKIPDLNGIMFISFSYTVIDGKKTILYFSYE